MTDLESAVQAFLDVLETPPGPSWWWQQWQGNSTLNVETLVDGWPDKRTAILKAAREMVEALIENGWAIDCDCNCPDCLETRATIDRLLAQKEEDMSERKGS